MTKFILPCSIILITIMLDTNPDFYLLNFKNGKVDNYNNKLDVEAIMHKCLLAAALHREAKQK